MTDGIIMLVSTGDVQRRGIMYHNFSIQLTDGETIGSCNLRYGNNDFINYAGNIGYEIDEAYRGNHYAVRAVRLLTDYAVSLGITSLILCCAPENKASRRTCELCGAEYDTMVQIPPESELYAYGRQESCRYIIKL